jgi:hypothetical protein
MLDGDKARVCNVQQSQTQLQIGICIGWTDRISATSVEAAGENKQTDFSINDLITCIYCNTRVADVDIYLDRTVRHCGIFNI